MGIQNDNKIAILNKLALRIAELEYQKAELVVAYENLLEENNKLKSQLNNTTDNNNEEINK